MSDDDAKLRSPSGDDPLPKAVVTRLSLYLRELQLAQNGGAATISSGQLGKRLGFTDAQVRKDLSRVRQPGQAGVGYRCRELIAAIKERLGTNLHWPVALIGLGNLGSALLGHRGFQRQGFQVEAAFDIDERKIGKRVRNVIVYPMSKLQEVIAAKGIRLAILTVTPDSAQAVVDQLVAAGIEGILNFVPVTLTLPESVPCVAVDLAIELEHLTYAVVSRGKEAGGDGDADLTEAD